MSAARAVLVSVFALAAVGCLDPDETEGDLGNAAFRYVCLDASDAACDFPNRADDFPAAIAVGARFGLQVRRFDAPVAASVVPASPRFVSRTTAAFQALAPGRVAMLAQRHQDGAIEDFTHLTLSPVASVAIEAFFSTLHPGDTMTVDANPGLAGALDYSWSSSDPDVVHVAPMERSRRATLRAVAPGSATIRASTEGITGILEVEVAPRDSASTDAATPIDAAAPTATDGAAPIDDDAGDDDAG